MIFKQLFDQETSTYTYLLADAETRVAVIIDPVISQVDRDLQVIYDLDLSLKAILETHVHADHITGSALLREQTDATIVVPAGSGVLGADSFVGHDDVVSFGRHRMSVLTTPGHTASCVSYLLDDDAVFTGDVLLIGGTGRTDFQEGDAATLYRSVTEKLFTLPDHVRVFPGHDYHGQTQSSIGAEKQHNPRLAGKTEAEYVALMAQLKLALPKHINEAVPGNLLAGLLLGDGWEVSPEWVVSNHQELTLLDVRPADEFNGPLGHIPGAINVFGILDEQVRLLSKNARIVTVCRSGKRSLDTAKYLRQQGVGAVWSMQGGMLSWQEKFVPKGRW